MKPYRFENPPLLKAFSKRPGSDNELEPPPCKRRVQPHRNRFGYNWNCVRVNSAWKWPTLIGWAGRTVICRSILTNRFISLLLFSRFYLRRNFGERIKNGKSHSSRLAQFDRKMSFKFPWVSPAGLCPVVHSRFYRQRLVGVRRTVWNNFNVRNSRSRCVLKGLKWSLFCYW